MSENLTVFEAQVRGEVDMQVATAKAYPRNITKFLEESRTLALSSDEVAASMMYALPRKEDGVKKVIEGPSARFAEIIASRYRNCRVAARVMGTDATHVTAQAVFFDLETNVARSIEVKRRITDRNGNRYSDDMIITTSNAAASIAARECVLKGVPEAVWGPIYEAARERSVGKGGDDKTFLAKRKALLAALLKMGATDERVLLHTKVAKLEDLTPEQCMELEALKQAIRDGGTTLDECFPAPGAADPEQKAGLAGLKDKIEGGAA